MMEIEMNWPLVAKNSKRLPDELLSFINLNHSEQIESLRLYQEYQREEGINKINRLLGSIYSILYGYDDAKYELSILNEYEVRLLSSKAILENQLIHVFTDKEVTKVQDLGHKQDLLTQMKQIIKDNAGIKHSLFDLIETDVNLESIKKFLILETIRNEVVDDEVAFLFAGVCGSMKEAVSKNLWDEVGRGDRLGWHTYWLKELVYDISSPEELIEYRTSERPDCSITTSNIFNCFLTKFGYKYFAYGCFMLYESWVEPHFLQILKGMERNGLSSELSTRYFVKHCEIDPFHYMDLLTAIETDMDKLSIEDLRSIVIGMRVALNAAIFQYKGIYEYLHTNNQIT